MQIEVVGFYPNAKKTKGKGVGTLHVYIVDLDLDLRGIGVLKNGNTYHFMGPQRFSKDGTDARYPIFNFTSTDKQKEFNKVLKLEGTKFMREEEKKIEKENKDVPQKN